jgi:hypothetical protein
MGAPVAAVVGSVLLAITPFAPFVSAPIVGRLTLFQQGKGDGVVLLACAIIALAGSFLRRYGPLWISGAIGAFETGNLFWFFARRLPEIIDNYRQQTSGNIFSSIGELALTNLDPDWGAFTLLLGTSISLVVAGWATLKRQVSLWWGVPGIALLLIVVTYHVAVAFFPYVANWPELLKSN